MTNKYQWQGEPVKAIFGHSYIDHNDDKPLYWYNYECQGATRGACIPSIQITTQLGTVFYIANHFGIGANKLKKGGWPDMPHFSIPDSAKFEPDRKPPFGIRELDLEGFEEYEQERRTWQMLKYPEEYKRLQSLREKARQLQKR